MRIEKTCDKSILKVNRLILFAILLACFTPRFIGFMKVNIGFNMSFYSLLILAIFFFSASYRKIHIRKNINALFLPIILIVVILHFIRTDDMTGWTQYLFYVLICNLLMLLLCKYADEVLYIGILKIISFSVFIHVIIGVYEVTSHQYVFEVGRFSNSIRGSVAVSIFYNPNDYSMFIATMLPFVFFLFLKSKKISGKLFYGITIIGSFSMLFATASRAAILSLLGAGILLCMLLFKRNKYRMFVLLTVLVLILAYLLFPGFRSTVNQVLIDNSIDVESQSDYIRVNLLKNGLHFLNKTHWMGVGAGSLKIWFETQSVYYIGRILYMHNWYMEVLVTFGILVFLLYIIFHGNIFISLYKNIKQKEKDFAITLTFFTSFFIFSITSISSSSNVYSEWFWMYLALVASYIEYLSKQNNLVVD